MIKANIKKIQPKVDGLDLANQYNMNPKGIKNQKKSKIIYIGLVHMSMIRNIKIEIPMKNYPTTNQMLRQKS